MKGLSFTIHTKEDLKEAIKVYGFVPFFRNSIPGFSIAEHVAPEAWFESEEGVWEWKGPVIRELGCAYGKFFEHKAVYISSEWFPDFANLRRDGYDFDARYEDGLSSRKDKELYTLVEQNGPILSKRLKGLGGYGKGKKSGFDTSVNRLQSQGYLLISDFVYERDKYGQPYGWGVAEYATPEQFLGKGFREKVYEREPEESLERLVKHVKTVLPDCGEQAIRTILQG